MITKRGDVGKNKCWIPEVQEKHSGKLKDQTLANSEIPTLFLSRLLQRALFIDVLSIFLSIQIIVM